MGRLHSRRSTVVIDVGDEVGYQSAVRVGRAIDEHRYEPARQGSDLFEGQSYKHGRITINYSSWENNNNVLSNLITF